MIGIEVRLKKGESQESLANRFKKKMMKSGIIDEIRERQGFMTKGQRRRMKQRETWR